MANKITTILDLKADAFTRSWKDARKAVTDADGVVNKFRAGWAGAMDGFRRHSKEAAVAGGVAFTAFAAKAIDEASNLAESVNAVNVTFDEAAGSVLKLGENSAESFGLAKSEFNQLAVQFSAFAKNIATATGGDVSSVLGDLTTRVADFASVMNIDLAEATQVFMSTLAGETEPIRRFGKDVSAAAVEQFALTNGLIKSKVELTENIKQQARYGLLMQQTADTAGDFANTSDELANSQRILRARLKDTAAEVGEDLTPVLLNLVELIGTLVDTAETLHLDDVFGIPDQLFRGAEAFGRNLGRTAQFWTDMDKNWNVVERFDEASKAAADFDRTLLDGLSTFEQVRSKVLELTGSQHAANLVAIEWNQTNQETPTIIRNVGEALDVADQAWQDYVNTQAGATAAAEGAPGTFQEMQDAVGDLSQEVEEAVSPFEVLTNAIQGIRDAIDEAFGDLEDDLDQLDQLARIEEQFAKIAEGTDDVVEQQEQVRDLIGLILDYVRTLDDIPPEKVSEIIAKLRTGDVETLRALLDDLTQDRFINIGFTPNRQQAFDSVNAVFAPGAAPTAPTFIPTQSAIPSGSMTVINNYPVGTTPTTQYQNDQTDIRRNGIR